jgi:hypothetical protein
MRKEGAILMKMKTGKVEELSKEVGLKISLGRRKVSETLLPVEM